MKRSLLLAFLVAAPATASAQQDLSARLLPATQPRAATYDLATGSLRSGASAFLGGGVPGQRVAIYDNTCVGPLGGLYAAMNPGDVFLDNGQLPSDANTELPGCLASYPVGSFVTGYCTDQATVDLTLTFYSLQASCTGLTGPGVGFALTGLPGSTSGLACWVLTVDLNGTSFVFTMHGDGDGVYDDAAASDTFGASYEIRNVTGTAGILLGGSPVFLGTGCDFAVGTAFEVADPTGSSPTGTGYGTADAFGLMQGGAFAGCFFFGGWPANAWSSYYLEIHLPPGVGPGCDSPVGPPTCACPEPAGACSNWTTETTGCVNSQGLGALLDGAPSTPASVGDEDLVLMVTQLPPNAAGLFVVGTLETSGTPLYDGIFCLGGNTLRLNPGAADSAGVRFSNGPGPTSLIGEGNSTSTYFIEYTTYYFQHWYRDLLGSPCGTNANFSNVVPVTMQL